MLPRHQEAANRAAWLGWINTDTTGSMIPTGNHHLELKILEKTVSSTFFWKYLSIIETDGFMRLLPVAGSATSGLADVPNRNTRLPSS